ncbi:MAG: hypothetical protein QOE61_1493 [Micromonosporaceae bacterium]|jgi:hypothetical protein|nr:hypothetical protein [Micromonosporaceae bacterium]
MPLQHERLHRAAFTAAGLYNIGWGLLAVVHPQWLFRLADMAPQIFMTLGMVLGLYGLLYLEVARRPANGFAVAAVGLTGKVLGPLGWLWLYLSGQWPLASGVLIVTNDLVWWLPFGLYLRDAWPTWRNGWVRDRTRRGDQGSLNHGHMTALVAEPSVPPDPVAYGTAARQPGCSSCLAGPEVTRSTRHSNPQTTSDQDEAPLG